MYDIKYVYSQEVRLTHEPPPTSTNGPVEILIAQDSPTRAEQLKHMLEQRGHAVTVAANGKEALEAARIRKPSLIVSDILMPEMDGYALCKHLKTEKELKDVPVILMTSLSSTEDVVKGLECGADMFIRKPYDEPALLSRIDYALSNRRLRERAKRDVSLQIKLGDNIHHITSEPQQILDLLISTYEDATRINAELGEKQIELTRLAAGLEREVEERTAALRTEIAGHKMAAEQLRQSEEQFRLIAENISDLIAVLNLDGKRLYNSPSYRDILGDPGACAGRSRSMKFIPMIGKESGTYSKKPSGQVAGREPSIDSCLETGVSAISSPKGVSFRMKKGKPRRLSSSLAM